MVEIKGIGVIATNGLRRISTRKRNMLELHYINESPTVKLRFNSSSAYYRAYSRLKAALAKEEMPV